MPPDTTSITTGLPLSDQISEILRQLQSQAPEVLEMGVRKVRTTAELQIAGYVAEWLGFLVAVLLLSRIWQSWGRKRATYLAWKEGSRRGDAERPDPPSDAHDVWAGVAVIVSGILLFLIVIQVGWYLPDQVSYIVNARYYAVLELIHQIRG